jgi:hypothetical protein
MPQLNRWCATTIWMGATTCRTRTRRSPTASKATATSARCTPTCQSRARRLPRATPAWAQMLPTRSYIQTLWSTGKVACVQGVGKLFVVKGSFGYECL